jgi:gamma-glutamylcyclotransferase (GGCT)/AIG2-like uncharacterized protein YtfP
MSRKKNRKKRKRGNPAGGTLYFGYGSNMHGGQMRGRCPNAVYAGNAALYGWEVVERLHADIDRVDGGVVYGTLWYVNDRDLQTLDRYEGTPTYYERVYVSVVSERGTETALVYVMTPRCKARRDPQPYAYSYALTCYSGAVEFGVQPHASFKRALERGDGYSFAPSIFSGPTVSTPWEDPDPEVDDEEEFEQMVEDWQNYGTPPDEDEEEMLYNPDTGEYVPAGDWVEALKGEVA